MSPWPPPEDSQMRSPVVGTCSRTHRGSSSNPRELKMKGLSSIHLGWPLWRRRASILRTAWKATSILRRRAGRGKHGPFSNQWAPLSLFFGRSLGASAGKPGLCEIRHCTSAAWHDWSGKRFTSHQPAERKVVGVIGQRHRYLVGKLHGVARQKAIST